MIDMKMKFKIFSFIMLLALICATDLFAQKDKIIKLKNSDKDKKYIDSISKNIKLTAKEKSSSDTNTRKYIRSAEIKLSNFYKGDSVVLRWGISTPGGWVTANNSGFIIERIALNKEGQPEYTILTEQPLRPWSLEKWKANSDKNDRYAAIASQCLYGKLAISDLNKGNNTDDYVRNLRYAAIELSNKHGFAHFVADINKNAANGLALRYVDRDIKEGYSYIYTVKVAVQDTTYFIYNGKTAVKYGSFSQDIQHPLGLKVYDNDKRIALMWDNSEAEGFTAYELYRSQDNGKSFIKINSSPIVPMEYDNINKQDFAEKQNIVGSYTDTTVALNTSYLYCLKGINSFAEETGCSNVVAIAIDKKATVINNVKSQQIGNHILKINWETKVQSPQLVGFAVSKSNDFEGGYFFLHQDLIKPDKFEFIDSTANDGEPYYIITAVDSNGAKAQSIPHAALINDTTPPSKPAGLWGTIDKSGKVELNWDLGPENNIVGYKVLWANDSNHTFNVISKEMIDDTTYVDSVTTKTISKYVYYRIAAFNHRYAMSELSDILQIKRVAAYPPQSPVFSNFQVNEKGINIKWEYSRSEEVKKQEIFRRVSGEEKWQLLKELPFNSGDYIDSDILPDTYYEYLVKATDVDDLYSFTKDILKVKSNSKMYISNDIQLKAEYDNNSKAIKLNWNLPQNLPNEEYWFAIYKSYSNTENSNKDLELFETVKSDKSKFVDNLLVGKGTYKYSIMIVTNKTQSKLSNIESIIIK
jgi:hypothetical protein